MLTTTSIRCPLCVTTAAISARPNFDRYLALDCSGCGQLVVSEHAYDRILGLPREFKDQWRAMIASAPAGKILLIIVEPVGSGGGLETTIVDRTELRL